MTDEVVVPVVQEDDEAAFNAGYAEARGEEVPPQDEAKPEVTPPEEEEAEETPAKVEPEAEAPPIVAAGLTDEQLTAMLAKLPELKDATDHQIRQIYGKFGELQKSINEIKNGGSGGTSVRLAEGALKRMSAEFPEMAKMLTEDLSEAFQVQGGGGFDPASLEPLIEQRLAGVQEASDRKMETKLLTLVHRDWKQAIASDEYKVWLQTLDAETQKTIGETWDGMYLADRITEFKDWYVKSKSTAEERSQRLESALIPQGTPVPGAQVLSDDDAFLAGYKSVAGR